MFAFWWQLPADPLRTSVLRAGAIGVLAAAAVAMIVRAWLQLGMLYPLKAVSFFSLAMGTGLGLVQKHHPYDRFGPANHVTMLRAALVALVAALIGEPAAWTAAAMASTVVVALTVLDGIDGWLARRSGMVSAFGARFDMEIDAVLVLASSILVWQHGKAGVWVVVGGLLRYAFSAAAWCLPWMARPLRPTRRARTIAVAHLVGLSVALAPFVIRPYSAIAAGLTLLALTWSFAVDIRRLWRME
jgi:phosphatidylglycerophosphate synthase